MIYFKRARVLAQDEGRIALRRITGPRHPRAPPSCPSANAAASTLLWDHARSQSLFERERTRVGEFGCRQRASERSFRRRDQWKTASQERPFRNCWKRIPA